MPRFILSLFLAATLVPASIAVRNAAGNPWFANFRSGALYSTTSRDKEALVRPGVELYIAPRDTFDFLPSTGYGTYVETLEKDLSELGDSRNAVVRGSEENLIAWASAQLNTKDLSNHSVPRPNESLVGKILVVEESSVIYEMKNAVLCHALEEETHFCHKLHSSMDITQLTVSPNGKESHLWVGCHYGEGDDEDEDDALCHVMNVGDRVFFPEDKSEFLRSAQVLMRGSN